MRRTPTAYRRSGAHDGSWWTCGTDVDPSADEPSADLGIQQHLHGPRAPPVERRAERVAVLSERVHVRDHLVERRAGLEHQLLRDLEGVPAGATEAFLAVADVPLHVELAEPQEAQVELGDLWHVAEHHDAAARGRVAERLVEALLGADA